MTPVRGVRPRTLAFLIAAVLVAAAIAALVWMRPPVPVAGVHTARAVSAEATPTALGSFPAAGTPPLRNPLGIAVADDRVFVAESDAGDVRVFGTDGSAVSTLPVPPAPGTAVAYPADVAVLSNGRVAVLDTADRRVLLMRASDGKLLGTLGSSEPTALAQPTSLTADGDEVYVADAGDHTVKVFGRDGRLERTLGKHVRPALTFVGGLALVRGRLWVSDSNAGRVVALDAASGEQVAVLPEAFSLPRGLCGGPDDSLQVTDAFSRTLRSFDASLTPGFTLSFRSEGGTGPGASPRDVAYSAGSGEAYVTDAAAGAVRVYRFAAVR